MGSQYRRPLKFSNNPSYDLEKVSSNIHSLLLSWMCDTLVHSCCKEYQKDKNNDNTSANSSFGLKKIVLQWTKGYLYAGVRKNQTKRDEIGEKCTLITKLVHNWHFSITNVLVRFSNQEQKILCRITQIWQLSAWKLSIPLNFKSTYLIKYVQKNHWTF